MPPNDNDTLNLELKILEAYSRDIGRGIARIDYDSMDSIIATTGDIIEIRVDEKKYQKDGSQVFALKYPKNLEN